MSPDLDEIKRGMDTIHKFIRKTDEEYCINAIKYHPVEKRSILFLLLKLHLKALTKLTLIGVYVHFSNFQSEQERCRGFI